MGLARRAEKRYVSFQNFWGADLGSSAQFGNSGQMYYGQGTFSGVNVTQQRALRSVAVLACIGIIADSVSAMPWDVSRKVKIGLKQAVPMPALLEQPDPELSRFDWLQRIMTSLLMDGNSYSYISRDDSFNVIAITPIHPYRVVPHRDETTGKKFYVIDGSEIIQAGDILHIMGFNEPGALRGMSPIENAKEAIGLSLVAEEYGARFYGQGATASGVISMPGAFDKEAAPAMAKQFQEKHSGSAKSHLPLVLYGAAEWTPLTIPNNQAQFLETRQFQAAEIARLYRVPLHLIQELDKGTSWGTGIEQQNIGFIRYTLMPWLVRIEEALSALLPGKQCVKFNVDSFLRATMFERYQSYALALTNGFLNKDEVRAIEEMPPIVGGDGATYLQPLNLGPAGDPDKNGDPVGKATKKIMSLIGQPGSAGGNQDLSLEDENEPEK